MTEPNPTLVATANPYGGRGPLLMGVTWTMAAIAILLMILRTYTNAAIVKHFSWDYAWALTTLASALLGQSMNTVATSSGLGNHLSILTHPQTVSALKWDWLGQVVILNAIGFGKIAVCAFLLRIQDRTHSKGKWFLYFIAVSMIIVNFNSSIQMMTQCTPLAHQWDRLRPGSCDHIQRTARLGYFSGSWAAASDIALAVYPIFAFGNLRMSWKVKTGIFLLLGGGVLASISSIIKTLHIRLIALTTDITYGITDLVFWGLVECWLVLILGSLPPLRSLFIHVHEHISSTASRSRRTTQGYRRSTTDKVIPMYARSKGPTGDESHESEEYIVGDVGITKTTEIHISREGKRVDDDDKKAYNPVGSEV